MTPDVAAIGRPLKYFRTNPVQAAAKLPVDRTGGKFGAGLIRRVSIVTEGEALGHDNWIDSVFTASVASAINQLNKGAKARFTHPSLSGDGLGRYMGRAFEAYVEGKQVFADIHLAKAAHDTPGGNLADYVMGLAEEDPEAFAISIAFERDIDAENSFAAENSEDGDFRSPSPDNENNFRHVRLKSLVAADFVDTPAANPGGLFHMGEDIAAEADRLCAYALGLSEEKPEASCFDADADRVAAFAQRFLNSRSLQIMSKNPEATPEQKGETVSRSDYDALAAKFDQLSAKFDAIGKKPEGAEDPAPVDAAEVHLAERKRVAELYKLATSAAFDNPTEAAEKWAEQGLSLVEAKAALADRMLAGNRLTDGASKPEDDPDAKFRAEYRKHASIYAESGMTEDQFIAAAKDPAVSEAW